MIPSPERQAAMLAAMPNVIVATIRRDGTPQLTPNWYLWTGAEFWISTPIGAAKTHNLRRDPRLVLCIDDTASGDYVQISGTATIIEGDEARKRTLDLCRKYMAEDVVSRHWETITAKTEYIVIAVSPHRWQWHDH